MKKMKLFANYSVLQTSPTTNKIHEEVYIFSEYKYFPKWQKVIQTDITVINKQSSGMHKNYTRIYCETRERTYLPFWLICCWTINLTKYSLEWENEWETLATRLFWHTKGMCRGVSLFAWGGRMCKNRNQVTFPCSVQLHSTLFWSKKIPHQQSWRM